MRITLKLITCWVLLRGQKGDVAGAVDDLNRAIQLDPQFAGAHYNLGAAFWFGGQRVKALTELKEAVRLDPTFVQAYLFLGMASKESGDHDAALNSLHNAIALSPNLFPAYIDQGVVLLRMGPPL